MNPWRSESIEVYKSKIMEPPAAGDPNTKPTMKPQPTRPWTALIAIGAMIGLTGCESDEMAPRAYSGISAVGASAMIGQVGATAPAVEPPESTPPAPETGAVAVPPPVVAPPDLPPGVDEVVQLAQTQIGDEVLLAYIENSPARFELDIHQILYLHDLGISAQVIAAMVRHHQTLDAIDAVDTPGEIPSGAPALAGIESAPERLAVAATEPGTPPAPTAAAVSTEASAPAVTHNHFYTALAPYGTWVEVPEYGWSWRPTVAVIDPHWRPYVHGGRWVYTDYGWYWHSYYSWGWAPFHYGRWHLSSVNGWVWVPDTRWGPAWVTWRYYDGYYGWAPLPPRAIYTSGVGLTYYGRHVGFGFSFGLGASWYSFVPVRHFYTARPWYHCAPHSRVTQIYNNSTVINNYIVGDNNTTIINVGPGTDSIAAVTRTEIQRVTIQDVDPGESRTIRAESLSRDGTTLAAYRPQLPAQAPAPPPEITRRQTELQRRTETVASSDAAQVATIRARQPESTLGRQSTGQSLDRAQPSSAPRVVRIESGTGIVRPTATPVSPRTASPAASRSEPQARPSVPQSPAGTGGTIRAGEVIQRAPARAPVASPTTPSRPNPAAVPAAPRAAEPRRTITPQTPPRAEPQPSRIQPVRPVPVAPTIPNQSVRVEPVRPANPAYSVSSQPSPFQNNPRPITTPRFEPQARQPFAQPSAPTTPNRFIAPQPTFNTAPRQVAPARSTPSPAPAVRTPTIQPRSASPAPAAPVRAPARPSSAPAQPARGAGSR
jgi:hypothetical protein